MNNNTDLILADRLEEISNNLQAVCDWVQRPNIDTAQKLQSFAIGFRELSTALALISAEIRKAGEEG